MVWMAKNGGMSNEDVSQFIKYAGGPTTGAKLPDEYMAAMGMILRRSGVRGDEAGVFGRSAASKLVAPTQKGRDALAAMGIDFNKFTAIDAMNSEGVGIMMKNKFGARLSPEMKSSVEELIKNGEFTDPETGENRSVISDSGEFVSQMSQILGPLFHDKKGKMSAQDAKALSKALADYQKYSIDSVDAVGLMNAIAGSNPTLGNLNAFFTDKQGGRANMIFQQWGLFQELLSKMQNVPGGVANKIGTEANQGVYGDWTKLTGTVETAMLRISQDWEFATRPIIRTTDTIIDGFTNLSDGTRRLIEAFGAAVAVFAGIAAAKAGTSLIGGILGGAGTGAATGGAAAAAWGVAKAGSRFLGPLGAAITGWQIGSSMGKGAQAVGTVAGGKHWMPKDQEDADGLRALAEEKRKKIAEIRANSRIPEMADTLIQPLQQDLDMLENRIRAFDQLTVKPNIDTSSIDAAQAKVDALIATVSRWGVTTPAASGSTPSAGPTPPVSGARRRGGPVEAGKTYRVGEDGEERFTAGADGFITPNHALGGGGGGVMLHAPIQLTFHGATAADVKRAATEAAQAALATLTAGLDQKLNREAQTSFSNVQYGES
jgi:hypothetical protein